MDKVFSIDSISKSKMIAAGEIYKVNKKIHVIKSYKSDGYNVYVFSNFFHVGIRKTETTFEQKVIDVIQSPISEKKSEYDLRIKDFIGELNLVFTPEELEQKFKSIHLKINWAIDEFINRNNVYKNYIEVKNKQIELIREEIEKKIVDEENHVRRLLSKKLLFTFDQSGHGTPFELEMVAASYIRNERNVFEYSVARTPENLEILLNNALGLSKNNDLLHNLINFMFIISYYTSDDMFESLFKSSDSWRLNSDEINATERLKRLFKEKTQTTYNLEKIIRQPHMIYDFIRSVNLSNFNYEAITNLEHLQKIFTMYQVLVEAHKRYVEVNVKEVEMSFFALDTKLGSSKDTKRILSQLLQIDRLVARIQALSV